MVVIIRAGFAFLANRLLIVNKILQLLPSSSLSVQKMQILYLTVEWGMGHFLDAALTSPELGLIWMIYPESSVYLSGVLRSSSRGFGLLSWNGIGSSVIG